MKILEKRMNQLHQLCEQHKVDKMYLFGSAVDNKLQSTSDIDILVRFKKIDLSTYFENYITLKGKLKELFKREIDLVEEQALRNPILIKSINRNKALIYG